MSKNIQIGIALGIIFAASVFVAMAENAGSGSSGSIQTNPKIPSPPAPTLPAGFTIQQIQAAKDIESKELANLTKNQTEITKNQTGGVVNSIDQLGYGNFFVTWPFVDTQYNVYQYSSCIAGGGCTTLYPSLYLPLKIEVWDNIIYSDNQGYYWAYGAEVWTYLYYWNYYTNSWTFENSMHGYTASAGEFNAGFIIPYKLYSDKYFTYLYVRDGVHGNQWTDKFFTVNWR